MSWTVAQLNTLLGRELGRNRFLDPVFCWKWSEDLVWPTTFTGRMVTKKIQVPIIGGGTETAEIPVKEFKPTRMTRHRNCWIVCKWLSPSELVGLRQGLKIGDEPKETDIPRDVILRRWNDMFPGADFPESGWYINTDYFNKPFVKPAYDDTLFLIAQLKQQMSGMSLPGRYQDMLAEDDLKKAKTRTLVEDIAEDSFTAYLNPEPGKRGGFVSYGGVDQKELATKENP